LKNSFTAFCFPPAAYCFLPSSPKRLAFVVYLQHAKQLNLTGGPGMSVDLTTEQRSGPRYVIRIPVRAEWDDERSGEHIVVEGETENVGPAGALVHLETLPDVGGRVRLTVPDAQGTTLETVAEVLRLERNPVQPLAALLLLGATDEWRGLVWEPAGLRVLRGDDDEAEDYDH
jgi:hypothetical protein